MIPFLNWALLCFAARLLGPVPLGPRFVPRFVPGHAGSYLILTDLGPA